MLIARALTIKVTLPLCVLLAPSFWPRLPFPQRHIHISIETVIYAGGVPDSGSSPSTRG
jgi:hypothetical protein